MIRNLSFQTSEGANFQSFAESYWSTHTLKTGLGNIYGTQPHFYSLWESFALVLMH